MLPGLILGGVDAGELRLVAQLHQAFGDAGSRRADDALLALHLGRKLTGPAHEVGAVVAKRISPASASARARSRVSAT